MLAHEAQIANRKIGQVRRHDVEVAVRNTEPLSERGRELVRGGRWDEAPAANIFRATDRKRPVTIPVGRIPDPFALHETIEQRAAWQAQEKPAKTDRPRDRTDEALAGLGVTWASPHR